MKNGLRRVLVLCRVILLKGCLVLKNILEMKKNSGRMNGESNG